LHAGLGERAERHVCIDEEELTKQLHIPRLHDRRRRHSSRLLAGTAGGKTSGRTVSQGNTRLVVQGGSPDSAGLARTASASLALDRRAVTWTVRVPAPR